MPELKGLATGIGSLPHKDAESALDLIFKYLPDIPFWPQLPKRGVREGMLAQFSENLPCLKVSKQGLFFDPRDQDKELEKFYERIIAGDSDYFMISEDFALGLNSFFERLKKGSLDDVKFIKCQITGPFTFAAAVNNDEGLALLHDEVFMQAIVNGLSMKALWQVKKFKGFGRKIIVFIDEPYLGCFGSAYTPINRETVIKGLSDLTARLKDEGALTGVHCCGNTDWSIFTDTANIDIINFDAFSFLDKFVLYADNLKSFLKRGGIVCWGIVPTQEFSGKETAEALLKRLNEGIDTLARKGLDKDLIIQQMLLSPSCGLGTLDAQKSGSILKLLCEISSSIRKNP
jgi:methionine synthase II (cobalamin-independent)